MVGLFGDVVTNNSSGEYNYFDPALVPFMDPQKSTNALALSPMAIAYGLLNGFYEEFFFFSLIDDIGEGRASVEGSQHWFVLIPPMYQGMPGQLSESYGLFYYFMYMKRRTKNEPRLVPSCHGRR